MEQSEKDFRLKKELEIQTNPQSFWGFVKSQKCTSNSQKILIYNEKPLLTDKETCEAFAEYFCSIYSPLVPNIDLNRIFQLSVPEDIEILNISSVTSKELTDAFKKLKPKKSKGDDQVPQYFYKCYSELLIEPLLYIFNLCLQNSQFPTKWKRAAIVPIPKVSMTKEVSEHRPISLLSTPGKLLESVLYTKISSHVLPKLSLHQYGFQPHHSTTTYLVNFSETISKTLNDGNKADVLYTDFRKAFDLVSFKVQLQIFIYLDLPIN